MRGPASPQELNAGVASTSNSAGVNRGPSATDLIRALAIVGGQEPSYRLYLCLSVTVDQSSGDWMNRHPLVDYSPSDILTNAGWRTTEVGVDMTDPSSATSVTVLDFKVEAEPRGQRHVKLFRKDFDTISESRWPFIRLSISRIFQSSVTISPDLFLLDPLVFSCTALKTLGVGFLAPKLIYVPINPIFPPPMRVVPDFEERPIASNEYNSQPKMDNPCRLEARHVHQKTYLAHWTTSDDSHHSM